MSTETETQKRQVGKYNIPLVGDDWYDRERQKMYSREYKKIYRKTSQKCVSLIQCPCGSKPFKRINFRVHTASIGHQTYINQHGVVNLENCEIISAE